MAKPIIGPNPYRSLLDQAKTWFGEHGYTVGLPFVWDFGKTRSDFRVSAPDSDWGVSVIFLQNARPERLSQWLKIQRKPGVYVITELGVLGLARCCPDCYEMTIFEPLTALKATACHHILGATPELISAARFKQEQLDSLYRELERAPDMRYPGDLDQGMKLVKDGYYEIKPLHFGRIVGMTAPELRKLVQLAGGYGTYDRIGGRTEKVWRIPRRPDPELKTGVEPWTFDEEPL